MKNKIISLTLWIIPNLVYLLVILMLDNTNAIYHAIRQQNVLMSKLFAICELAVLFLPYFISTFLYGKIVGKEDKKQQLKKGIMCVLWIVFDFTLIFCFLWDADFFMVSSAFFLMLLAVLGIKAIYHFIKYRCLVK